MSFGMAWLLVLGVFFAFIAWGVYVDGHSSEDPKKEKLEKSPMHKIWIGVGIIIAFLCIVGLGNNIFR
jgi:hypothetical protein|tara:strand:+ start:367 stop:570 length:204 start_codon:yes stop_codon:yes gene_type:complete